ncbi:MAG: type II toxin-antitoxin system VapC family toxin [Gemmataceae bacterium]
MKLVVDSTVAFKWVVPEVNSDKSEKIQEDFQNQRFEIHTPDIFPIELAHALTRSERQGRILVGQAEMFWGDIMTTAPTSTSSTSLALRTIQISSDLRIGVYDCLDVALAEIESCDFVTADERLIRNLQSYFPFVVSLDAM